MQQHAQKLDFLARRLLSPTQQIAQKRSHLQQLELRLQAAVTQHLQRQQQRLLRLAQNLQHLNPHAVLKRGYALVQSADGAVIHSSLSLEKGQTLQLTFDEGSAEAAVSKISP